MAARKIAIEKIPSQVVDALHERRFSDSEIEQMEPEQMFREYCNWHGLIGWGGELWSVVHALSKI